MYHIEFDLAALVLALGLLLVPVIIVGVVVHEGCKALNGWLKSWKPEDEREKPTLCE